VGLSDLRIGVGLVRLDDGGAGTRDQRTRVWGPRFRLTRGVQGGPGVPVF
jgi:hypothetical protein